MEVDPTIPLHNLSIRLGVTDTWTVSVLPPNKIVMNKSQDPLVISFGHEWRIHRPYVYRYLQVEYVDAFFATGALRLSSFAVFSRHTDEERLDTAEGHGFVINRNQEGEGSHIGASMSQGQNAYVLCGATCFTEDLSSAFQNNSGFRINDTLRFAEAISRYIPGFSSGLEGSCHYVKRKMVDRDHGPIGIDSLKVSTDSKDIDGEKLFGLMGQVAGDDLYFLKNEKFRHQNEYRFLWQTPTAVNGTLDLVCPEARQFCTRFEDLLAEGPNQSV